ncbi:MULTISPECIES: Crp/Fnr family transcriptional regulator [Sphingomonadaceae]|mgnify:FL=1|jgi:CRP/FNR family transcriptional regulator|nr:MULTISPECIES: Crp/Fnr family transcriptional regulator [Sphingomonadaceae]MBB3877098.1 CRP/FNR family transcriptional regulator [Sphingomonas aquatilis]MDK8187541.1 Crp/Fnr family transcriptional regulator [Sphingomonas zeae]MDR6790488.1 CRP/FNR family transcriptional regulator [Sphingomonas sp. BE138]
MMQLAAAQSTLSSRCMGCAARSRSLCSNFSPEAAREFDRLARPITLARGETLVWEDDDTLLVGFVVSGVLKLTASLADGREQILGLAGMGDVVGRPFGTRSSYSVTALGQTRLCVLGRPAFEQFAATHPEVEHALLLRALDELDRARRWMLLLGRKSAGERVASLLVEFAERSPEDNVAFPLTRQQMGDLLGLSLETVSRELSKLKARGLITLSVKHFRVEDEACLRQRAA